MGDSNFHRTTYLHSFGRERPESGSDSSRQNKILKLYFDVFLKYIVLIRILIIKKQSHVHVSRKPRSCVRAVDLLAMKDSKDSK